MSGFYSYRLTYAKTGTARYIGHLDLQNLFHRAMRRAGIKARYSEGFNPHPIISFASPLSVGMEGLAELADIDLAEHLTPSGFIQKLNTSLPAGLSARDCAELPAGSKKAASLVRKASYSITVRAEDREQLNLEDAVNELIHEESDMRGLIYALTARANYITTIIACGGSGNLKPAVLAEALCTKAGAKLCGFTTEYCRRELIF